MSSSPSSLGEVRYQKHELRDPWETTRLLIPLCSPLRNGVITSPTSPLFSFPLSLFSSLSSTL